MMLKTKINREACLKVLLWIGMGCGTLHASAQNEVRDEDYSSLTSYFNLKKIECPVQQYRTGRVMSLTIDTLSRACFNGKIVELEQLKSTIKKDMDAAWKKSRQKEVQALVYCCAHNTSMDTKVTVLKAAKDAYEEIRNDIACYTNNKDEAYLDNVFPILICEDTGK